MLSAMQGPIALVLYHSFLTNLVPALPTQLALVFTRTRRLFKGILEEADAILSGLP
ncbi:MAG: hypothetical protein QOH31_2126 [Verrucomicrobiota bacterium]